MGQHELPRPTFCQPPGKRAGCGVGQVAPRTQNTLLQVIGIRPGEQPFLVVVALQHQQSHTLQRLLGLRRDNARVREYPDACPVMIHTKIDALRGVMAGGKHGDPGVPDVESACPRNDTQYIRHAGTLAAQGFRRSTAGVQRQTVLLCQRRHAANVVRVLVSQQNAGDIRRGQGKRLQGAAYSPRGDAGVHQKVGPAGADQQAVSLRPTG